MPHFFVFFVLLILPRLLLRGLPPADLVVRHPRQFRQLVVAEFASVRLEAADAGRTREHPGRRRGAPEEKIKLS